ncbi:hypothetical protein N7470_004072 [Penicillium chermesinum]|nr:hypothetical protein N7470_004072 [Penicillium chermesinum]
MDDSNSSPAPQHKRQRVAEENRKRAVRAVKEKCEGGVPCRRCLRYRRQCNFTHIEPGEKRRSTSVSLLERAASLNRHEIAEAERIHCMEQIISHYVPNATFDIQSLRRIAEDLKSKHRDSMSDAQSTRVDNNELEDLALDDEDFTIKALPDNSTQYSGEFSYLNFSMKIRSKIDEWMKTAAPEASTEVELFEDRWRATQLQSGSSLVSSSITCLPPRYVAEFLVQIFFKYAQTNNFYIEEQWLFEKLNICYTSPSSLSSEDSGAVCSLLMVLAVGTQFAHMESAKPVNRLPSDYSANQDHHFSEDEVGLTFYQYASKLLPDLIATASIRSVQACLLIGTYLLPLDTSGLCYTYFGLALKIAIQNGMHRRYHGEGLSPKMVETRNRVFWTAYTIEKRISILHGRPASLSDTDVDAPFLLIFPGCVYRNAQFMIDPLYENVAKRSNKNVSSDYSPYGNRPLFRSNVHLKLDYCLTRIFIGRPFLFSNIKGLHQPPQTGKGPSGMSKSRTTLITDCVEAALEIIDLCRLLRDETGLARASFTEFSSCRAALLVILAQGLTKRTERLGAALEQGISLIKIMSMGVGSARSAVSVIEALERAIRRLELWKLGDALEDRPRVPATASIKQQEAYLGNEVAVPQGLNSNTPGSAGINDMLSRMPITPSTAVPQAENGISPTASRPSDGLIQNEMSLQGFSVPDNFSLPHLSNFSFDHFVSNFPQELGEFTAIPCFEPDAQLQPPGNTSGELKTPGSSDSPWMQFMN